MTPDPSDPEDSDDFEREFITFYNAHARQLHRYLWHVGHDENLAEMAAQDAFVAACQKWAVIRQYDKPKAWLYKVAHWCLKSLQRSQYTYLTSADLHELPQPISTDDQVELRETVRWALSQLPRRLREVTVLHYLCDFSVDDTAKILCIAPGSVRYYLHNARKQLTDLLKYERGEEDDNA
ncbi:RNA polymerase sigma factor [Spirillospora sp. NPDC048911]|uniref:RNA polymerase sigma factor n=1 Tax=Spirillospora sp. NPDC048911 TaxID=3364527 RepID=UPI00371CE51F